MAKKKQTDIIKWLAISILIIYILIPLGLLPMTDIDEGIAGAVAGYLFTK